MFSNSTDAGACASTAAPSHWQDTKFDPSLWLDAKFDFTFPRSKPERDVNQLIEKVSSLNIGKETANDRSPSNATPPPAPPRTRKPLEQDEAHKCETSDDSDVSPRSNASVRGDRRSSSPTPQHAARANPRRLNRRSDSPASSSSFSPSPEQPQTLCSGLTKLGSPCQRSTPGRTRDWRCHNHRDSVGSHSKIPAAFPQSKPVQPKGRSGAQLQLNYSEWIPNYLQPETRGKLRKEMSTPPGPSDEPGYIYACERHAPGPGDSGGLYPFTIKVGRASSRNDNTRLAERRKNCGGCFHGYGMTERGWWPGNIDRNSAISYTGSTKSYIDDSDFGPEGKYHCKVERMVLLELGDVARNSVHLLKGFAEQNTAGRGKVNSGEGPDIPCPPRGPKPEGEYCNICKQVHREIFKLERIPGHEMTGKEWENVVLPIIERWGRFVTVFGDALASTSNEWLQQDKSYE